MLDFPYERFRTVPTFAPLFRSETGGANLLGTSQTVAGGAGIWKAVLPDCSIHNRDTNLLWSAIEGRLMGRQTPFVLRMAEGRRQPWPAGAPVKVTGIPHSDGALFSDGSGYSQRRTEARIVEAVDMTVATALIDVTVGARPEPGQHFSVDVRLYRILEVEPLTATRSRVTFWPPTREPFEAGADAEFDRPRCKVRLVKDDGMDISEDRDLGRFARKTIEMREDPS